MRSLGGAAGARSGRYRRARWIVASFLAGLCLGVGGLSAQEPEAPAIEISRFPTEHLSEYRIVPGDRLEVEVFGVDELSGVYDVRPDGRLVIPLVDRIQVAGLSLEQAERRLARILKASDLIQDPQVFVTLDALAPREVTISGGVTEPGAYRLEEHPTLLALLDAAGALPAVATDASILLVRLDEAGSQTKTPIDGEHLLTSRDPALDLPLRAGDIVLVRPRKRTRVYVLGAVEEPGLVEIESPLPSVDLALGAAGGTTPRAGLEKVSVIRGGPGGEPLVLTANLKAMGQGKAEPLVLAELDTVYVPYWPARGGPPAAIVAQAGQRSQPVAAEPAPAPVVAERTAAPAELPSEDPVAEVPPPPQPEPTEDPAVLAQKTFKRASRGMLRVGPANGEETFWIDRKPVSFQAYSALESIPRANSLVDAATDVRFDQAVVYCASAGKRLPTEQEWRLAFVTGKLDLEPLYEWTNSRYQPSAPTQEAETAEFRVLKGHHTLEGMDPDHRSFLVRDSSSSLVGFRCALGRP